MHTKNKVRMKEVPQQEKSLEINKPEETPILSDYLKQANKEQINESKKGLSGNEILTKLFEQEGIDQPALQHYLKSKNLKVKNDDEEQQKILKRTLKRESEAAALGSDEDDDDDSDDADFNLSEAELDNDDHLSEEYDSNAEGADSDVARDSDLDDDLANEDEEEADQGSELSEIEDEPPKKKAKTNEN
ncbi:hypothetical protein HANVADRAFT_120424 [Hanseniaspora valbyensis NRRL Y-1626]|uniref:Uncharacterized protein n=1 Tax=Hanseniaspora valbyensis NRRL Y-1626 TaxID=766949 RepID=A0A1B7TC12_9ASCO|nr:hypothetical protein HANVADRAFT_120424 [Hanseniaspora valbyensis NRRL Y-1626]